MAALAITVGVAACAAVVVEAWLAARNLRWLERTEGGPSPLERTEGGTSPPDRAVVLAAGRTRLGAATVGARALVALAAAAGGAEVAVARAGPVGALLGAALLLLLLSIPFDACETFVLRGRAGLNRTGVRLFLADQARRVAKDLLTAVALGLPLGLALPHVETGWWLPTWAAWVSLVIWRETMPPMAGRVRLAPLPPGPLAERLQATVGAAGLTGIDLMTAEESHRSPLLNARAEGIGRRRRIVIDDTVLAALDGDHVAAIVAHEAGHLAGHHRRKFALWQMGLGLALLLAADALGGGAAPSATLALLVLAAPTLGVFARPLEIRLIRGWEYDADRRAAGLVGADVLSAALRRLFAANATVPATEPLYAAFHQAHPAPAERLARLGGWRK